MTTVKELIVVITIGLVIFRGVKPIALNFCTKEDFSRRRNVWFVLTIVAFCGANFWVFAFVAGVLFCWAGRKDSNPVALYLLNLHVVPPIAVIIPIVGEHGLFELDNYRLLSLFILFPTAFRLWKSRHSRVYRMAGMDYLLLGYGFLVILLFVPPDVPNHLLLRDSVTNGCRRAFLFLMDVFVIHYVVSRSCSNWRAIVEAMVTFCISAALLASIGAFEYVRHWLLYADLARVWSSDTSAAFYLLRGDALRAQASSGHPLALGYLVSIGLGFWLYIQTQLVSARIRLGGSILFWLGLLAAYSRGPWVGAVVIYLAFQALGKQPIRRLFKATSGIAIVAALVAMSPFGTRIISVIPFLGGSVDAGSSLYRQRLAERSWDLMMAHPFFGDQMAYWKMEDLRQGQGIIDLVNTYAQVGLFYGFVGLCCFVGYILLGAISAYLAAKSRIESHSDWSLLGNSLVACIVGSLVMIGSCSLIDGYEKLYFVLGGLAAAYANLGSLGRNDIMPLEAPVIRR